MSRIIRTLTLAEIGTLLDWAAAEGWNPGLSDAVAFQAADPTGFFGAFVDGTMVAGISAVAYGEHFGFIGLYICHPDWRGHGHGKAVWDAGIDYLGARTIGLDGVAEQQANYESMGFVAAYETVRMSGTLPLASRPIEKLVQPADVTELERSCFPAERTAFLAHWLAPPNLAILHRSETGVDTYAVHRQCGQGAKIGPLFADSVGAALDLLDGFAGEIHIDVPSAQAEWLSALTARGFSAGFRTRRMYRGEPPGIDLARVFGVTSLELG